MSNRTTSYTFVMFLLPALAFPIGGAAQPAASQLPAFQQGLAARRAWEEWVASLSSSAHTGADYWAGQRSLENPGSCQTAAGEVRTPAFTSACEEARERLTAVDARRRGEPQFKLGWNSYIASARHDNGAATPSDAVWYLASSAQVKCSPVSTFFPKPGENYPSIPEGIIAGTKDGAVYHMDRPGYGPDGSEHHAPGPVVRLSDILGRYPTLVMVQGEAACQEAVALMAKAVTHGSVEQRWAAQNAIRDAQWHVVFGKDKRFHASHYLNFCPTRALPKKPSFCSGDVTLMPI